MDEKDLKLQNKIIKYHIAIISLITSLSFILFYLSFKNILPLVLFSNPKLNYLTYIFILFILSTLFIFFFQKKLFIQYFVGILLCLLFSLSISFIIFTKTNYYQFFLYIITLTIYHYTEYFSVLIYHFKDLSFSSYLIDQSKYWVFASVFSLSETLIGTFYFHELKQNKFFFILGLILTIIGQIFRISALYTGKNNFTHLVSYNKQKGHVLVKNGIYGISRHPSYFGFYLWSVGIQLMCGNVICFFGFLIALYIFFKDRIIDEEGMLIEFFGFEYIKYKEEVSILIPFIHMDKDEEDEHLENYYRNNRGNAEIGFKLKKN